MAETYEFDYGALDSPEVLRLLFHPRKTGGPRQDVPGITERLIPVDTDTAIGACFHTPPSIRPGDPVFPR